jgi:hypothetical protein
MPTAKVMVFCCEAEAHARISGLLNSAFVYVFFQAAHGIPRQKSPLSDISWHQIDRKP